jgi:DNA-binding CsgD family transcriptional regulator
MAVASQERLGRDLLRHVHRGAGVRDYSLGAARILARTLPFDGVCLVTMDPATLLPTDEVVENGLPATATPRLTEIELRGDDFNTFAELARSRRHAASLSESTGGDLDRSRRHRELKRPNGFGDELRAALVSDDATWGGLTLLRGADQRPFDPGDSAVLASVTGHLAEGLRRAILFSALSPAGAETQPAGLLLLAPDDSLRVADATAELWLAELREAHPDRELPPVVTAVASRARTIASGDTAGPGARARVRSPSGQWLLVHGSTLGDDATAVIIEPARPHELAPLIADAHGLSERERAVTQLVAQGLPTNAIAARLHISAWTVQDHLKAIFEKVGVGSRGELVARVFFEHYAPRLSDG